jgi:hypothetical protein
VDDAARQLPHGEPDTLEELARDAEVGRGHFDAAGIAPGVGHPKRRQLEAAFDGMGRIGSEILVVHGPVLLHP